MQQNFITTKLNFLSKSLRNETLAELIIARKKIENELKLSKKFSKCTLSAT